MSSPHRILKFITGQNEIAKNVDIRTSTYPPTNSRNPSFKLEKSSFVDCSTKEKLKLNENLSRMAQFSFQIKLKFPKVFVNNKAFPSSQTLQLDD